MTEKEKGILADAEKYLEAFSQAPRLDDPKSEDYWAHAAGVLAEAGNKWRQHPLAEKVFIGIYEYLEIKQKELSK